MHKMLIVLILCLIVLGGCAFLEGIAPSQLDEQGNAVPGTHTLTPTGQALAGNAGVFGGLATAIPLLIWNFIEIAKAKKDEKGLIATIQAIKSASQDPKVQSAWETIKIYLQNAHDVAGVTQRIKDLLAKI